MYNSRITRSTAGLTMNTPTWGEGIEPGEMNALEIQQLYFENLAGGDWVKYQKGQHGFLRKNIAFALFGAPRSEGDINDGEQLSGYTDRQAKLVKKVYNKVYEQKKYSLNNEDILVSILLVVCCKPKPLGYLDVEPLDYWVNLHQKRSSDIDSWCTPVFRVRKCLPINGGTGCRLYVDENGRVYQSWNSYLEENKQPKCVLVVPEDGKYQGTLQGEVLSAKLSVVPSPALGTTAMIVNATDTASTVTSLGACGVLVTAMFTPLAPVAITGAIAAVVGAGLYGLVRSSFRLHDRRMHEQTLAPNSSEARACYFNIGASTVGIAAGASTQLLARSAIAGTQASATGRFLKTSVDVLRYTNLLTTGGGLVNSFAHFVIKIDRGEDLSSLDMFQFAASTLFFANAVISNVTAQSIIEEAQTRTIDQFRNTLKDEQRNTFDQAVNAARETSGNVQGNTEIIRGIRLIGNKDQYYSDIINRKAGGSDIQVPVGTDGKVILDANSEGNSGIAGASLGSASQKIISKLVNTDEKGNLVSIKPGEFIRIGEMAYKISVSGAEYVAELLSDLSEWARKQLMLFACNVLDYLPSDFQRELRKIFPDNDLVTMVVDLVVKIIKEQRDAQDENKDATFTRVLQDFFVDGRVKKEKILQLYQKLRDQCKQERARNRGRREVACRMCSGIYFE